MELLQLNIKLNDDIFKSYTFHIKLITVNIEKKDPYINLQLEFDFGVWYVYQDNKRFRLKGHHGRRKTNIAGN